MLTFLSKLLFSRVKPQEEVLRAKKFNEYKCMLRSEMQTAGDMANVIKHQIENNIRLHGAAVNTENFNLI